MKTSSISLFTLSLLCAAACGGQTASNPQDWIDGGGQLLPFENDASLRDDGTATDTDTDTDEATQDDGAQTDNPAADDPAETDPPADDAPTVIDDDPTVDPDDTPADDTPADDGATDDTPADDSVTDTDDVDDDDLIVDDDDLIVDDDDLIIDDLVDDGVTDDSNTDDSDTDDGVTDTDDGVTADDFADDIILDDETDTDATAGDDETDPDDNTAADDTADDATSTDDDDDVVVDDTSADDTATDDATDDDTDPVPTTTSTPSTPPTSTLPPPPDEVPTGCTADETYEDEWRCTQLLTCEVDGRTESLNSNCYDNGDGYWSCWCELWSGETYHYDEYTLAGLRSSEDACTFSNNLCASGTPIVFPDAEECIADSESVSGDAYCNSQISCTQSVAFQGGVSAVKHRREQTYCSLGGDAGSWSCSCSNNERAFDYGLQSEAEPRDVCRASMNVCNTPFEYDPELESQCDLSTLSAPPGQPNCYAGLTCSQAQVVANQNITIYPTLYASCSDEGTDWECSCNNNTGQTEMLTVLDPASSSAACTTGINRCFEEGLVTPALNNGGGGPFPVER